MHAVFSARMFRFCFIIRRTPVKKAIRLFFLLSVMSLFSAIVAVRAQDATLDPVLSMPEQIAEGRDVTFTITNMPPETDTAAHAAWQAQAARFMELYPNVTIEGLEYTYQPDSFSALVAGGQV